MAVSCSLYFWSFHMFISAFLWFWHFKFHQKCAFNMFIKLFASEYLHYGHHNWQKFDITVNPQYRVTSPINSRLDIQEVQCKTKLTGWVTRVSGCVSIKRVAVKQSEHFLPVWAPRGDGQRHISTLFPAALSRSRSDQECFTLQLPGEIGCLILQPQSRCSISATAAPNSTSGN